MMLYRGKVLAVILQCIRSSIEKVQPLNYDKIINSSNIKEEITMNMALRDPP